MIVWRLGKRTFVYTGYNLQVAVTASGKITLCNEGYEQTDLLVLWSWKNLYIYIIYSQVKESGRKNWVLKYWNISYIEQNLAIQAQGCLNQSQTEYKYISSLSSAISFYTPASISLIQLSHPPCCCIVEASIVRGSLWESLLSKWAWYLTKIYSSRPSSLNANSNTWQNTKSL